MEERAQLGKGLLVTNLISLVLLIVSSTLINLLTGLILFALSLPVSAYISPKVLEKIGE